MLVFVGGGVRKGYKEKLPKRTYDDEGKPIWGYPVGKDRKNVERRKQKNG